MNPTQGQSHGGGTSMPSLSVSCLDSIPSLSVDVSGPNCSFSNRPPTIDVLDPSLSWICRMRSELDALAVDEAKLRSRLPCGRQPSRPSSASVRPSLHTAKRPEARQLNADLRRLSPPLPLPVYKEPSRLSRSANARASSSHQAISRGVQCAKADGIPRRTANRKRQSPKQRGLHLPEKQKQEKSVGGTNCGIRPGEKVAAEAEQPAFRVLEVSSHVNCDNVVERCHRSQDNQLSLITKERCRGGALSLR